MKKGILVVISGPSGVGKGTVLKLLRERNDNIVYSVSVTTRAKRPGETDGKDYYFKDFDQFKNMMHNNEFLETAEVYGDYYGTPKKQVLDMLDAGKDVILEIDTVGAVNVKKQYPEALLIFILPPSIDELYNRLVGRGTESQEQLSLRLNSADAELKSIKNYGYVVKNEVAEETAEIIDNIIRSAHYTVGRNAKLIKQFVGE